MAVKWFLEERDSEAALRLRSDFFEGSLQLRVPSLLPVEVLNALRCSGCFDRNEMEEVGRDIDRCGFVAVPLSGECLERTLTLALDRDLTISDASYLALAQIEACPLYTADEELVRGAPRGVRALPIRDYWR